MTFWKHFSWVADVELATCLDSEYTVMLDRCQSSSRRPHHRGIPPVSKGSLDGQQAQGIPCWQMTAWGPPLQCISEQLGPALSACARRLGGTVLQQQHMCEDLQSKLCAAQQEVRELAEAAEAAEAETWRLSHVLVREKQAGSQMTPWDVMYCMGFLTVICLRVPPSQCIHTGHDTYRVQSMATGLA